MHNATKKIGLAKDRLNWTLDKENGFTMDDIPKLATMIQSVDILEKYICDYEMKHRIQYNHIDYNSEEWVLSQVEDELEGAQTYHNAWTSTNDPKYKALAKEELGHAEKLLADAQQKVTNPNGIDKLQKHRTRYQDLMKSLV